MDQPEFTIKKGAIEAAAKFISENNKYFLGQEDYVKDSIRKNVQKMAEDVRGGKERFHFSTMGYTIVLNKDYHYYDFEVLVDLQVSQDSDFVEII